MTKAHVWKTERKRERRIYLVVHLALASSIRVHTSALGKLYTIDRSFDRSRDSLANGTCYTDTGQIRPIRNSQYDSILGL